MLQSTGVPVLLDVSERTQRHEIAAGLREAGFEVWVAEDHDHAVALLHGSARHIVTVVSGDQSMVLQFAASDRRMVHHHVYIAVGTPAAPVTDDPRLQFPYLTLLWVATSATTDLITAVAGAARMLGYHSPSSSEFVAR